MKKKIASKRIHIMTREKVMKTIRETARKLGYTPMLEELEAMQLLERWDVRKHFRNYSAAVRACGLEPRTKESQKIPVKTLFLEWTKVARRLGRLPEIKEFGTLSEIKWRTYAYQFGGWLRVPEAMARFAKEQKLEEEWQDVMKMIARRSDEGMASRAVTKPAKLKRMLKRQLSPIYSPLYGRAMVKGPMVNEPINEQGVLFLFGAMAEKLGFRVTLVQTGFPDIEALIEVSPGRWKRVRIEVEYESRNFIKHRHHAKGCDMIVCWIHNWKECPLEVIELSKLVG